MNFQSDPFIPYLFISAVLTYLLNRPFLNLTCHQDAGWHSYWAAFQSYKIPLKRQMNVLMGCTRIGSKYGFLLLFKIFGVQDPDQLSRKIFLIINFGTHLVLLKAVQHIAPGQTLLPYAIAGIYLFLTSNPYWFFHYESAERWVNLIHIGFFMWIVLLPTASSPLQIFGLCFFMALAAVFFKVSQGAEYLALWFYLMMTHHQPEEIVASIVGPVLAFLVFYVFLKAKGLWDKENLGVFGYASVSQKRFEGLNVLGKAAKKSPIKIVSQFLLWCNGKWIGALLIKIIQKFEPLRAFGPKIILSSLPWWILSAIALCAQPDERTLLWVGGLWLGGALLSLYTQGTFIPFHFIPLTLPLSLLGGLGLVVSLSEPFYAALFILSALVMMGLILSSVRNADIQTKEKKIWPANYHARMGMNHWAVEAASLVQKETGADDFVFAWGTLPQFYVLSQRRSPISWLNTNQERMDRILPTWRTILFKQLSETKPKFLVDFEGDAPIDEIEKQSGVKYELRSDLAQRPFRIYQHRL